MLRLLSGIDPLKALRASALRIGPVRARGVPAILLGAAGIVFATGVTRALAASAPTLPETLRVGPVQARGIPAILLGVATIVFTAGLTRALTASAPPETLREFRLLLESNRRQNPLNP